MSMNEIQNLFRKIPLATTPVNSRRITFWRIKVIAGILVTWDVRGLENIPEKGPLLIVGNHFHFLDTVAPIRWTQWPLEFIGDFEMPNAPPIMRLFPKSLGNPEN